MIVTGVIVTGVIVTGVIVTGVIVTGVTVTGVIVTGVIMTGVIMTRGGRLVAGCGQVVAPAMGGGPFLGVNLSPRRETVAVEGRKRDWNPLTHREKAVGACYGTCGPVSGPKIPWVTAHAWTRRPGCGAEPRSGRQSRS